MSYLDVYKKRLKNRGSGLRGALEDSTIQFNNTTFKDDLSYRVASVNFSKENLRDVRFIEDDSDQFTKYFLTRPKEKLDEGSYITTTDGTFLITSVKMDSIFPKAKALICNQIFRCKGEKDMPFNANNTTYGVKGLKDNSVYKEPDAKLKAIIQANDITRKYKVGMRVLFKDDSKFLTDKSKTEWIAYKVLKKDYTVLENQYVMELELSTILTGLDDLENGIAYNPMLDDTSPPVSGEFKIIGDEDIAIGEIKDYYIEPASKDRVAYRVDDITVAEIVEQDFKGKCKIKGLKEEYVKLDVVVGNVLKDSKWILVY